MQVDERYLLQFDPIRGSSGWDIEEKEIYAKRMQEGLLPHWPTEVLIEWFHRHAGCINDYAFLEYGRFRFSKQEWEISEIPGKEAFADPGFYDSFIDIEERAKSPYNWLAHDMLKHGTWNTPIVLLSADDEIVAPSRLPLNRPWHLLEGHKRLSYLNGLRNMGKANSTHCVWLVNLDDPQDNQDN